LSIIKILEEKMSNFENKLNVNVNSLNKQNITDDTNIDNISNKLIQLKIYPKTKSIQVTSNTDKPLEYFYEDNKLYQNNIIGNNYSLVNGYYFIAISNNNQIVNKAWDVQNGELIELTSYFDGSNNKLIIDSKEYVLDGSIILTSDLKIWIRINNCWLSK